MSGTGDIITRCSTCGFDFRLAYGHQCIGSGVQIDTDRTALKEENKRFREALEFYAGKTKFGKWEGPHLYSYDKFGGLCNDTIGPAIALKALADSSQGEK